jgi:hypothetical protein
MEVVSALQPANPTSVAGFGTFTGSASCPAGKVAVAGGYDGLGSSSPVNDSWFMFHYASYPSAPDTWTVKLKNRDAGGKSGVQIRVYVVCANPPQ